MLADPPLQILSEEREEDISGPYLLEEVLSPQQELINAPQRN